MTTAPYRFVPLPEEDKNVQQIVTPEWGPLASHDVPFKDGLSGHIDVTWRAYTDLCVAGERDGDVRKFYRNADGIQAIPGTSIRGMLRNVLQIAAFGRMGWVTQRRSSLRDLSRGNSYVKHLTEPEPDSRYHPDLDRSLPVFRSKVSAGWLTYVEGVWRLAEANYWRVEHRELERCFGLRLQDHGTKRDALASWDLLDEKGLTRAIISFDIEEDDLTYSPGPKPPDTAKFLRFKRAVDLRHNLDSSRDNGLIVVTGYPSHSKHREFMFSVPPGHSQLDDTNSIRVPPDVMEDFERIHSTGAEQHSLDPSPNPVWSRLRADNLADPDSMVPVFFIRDDQTGRLALGLSQMFRLAYRYSPAELYQYRERELLSGGSASLPTARAPDFADLLFGRIVDDEGALNWSLRGRVVAGMATMVQPSPERAPVTAILGSPKETFLPHYYEQTRLKHAPESKDPGQPWRSPMEQETRIAGWKRYPPRHEVLTVPPLENESQATTFVPIAAGFEAAGRIHFHNLKRVELGALAWVLRFGETLSESLGFEAGADRPPARFHTESG